jgi:hypothetical protein
MKPEKPLTLAARRKQLVGEIKRQRQVFSMQVSALNAPIASVKHGMERVQTLKQHPAPLIGIGAGAALAVLVIKPRRLAALARGMRKVVRLISVVTPLIARFSRRTAPAQARLPAS